MQTKRSRWIGTLIGLSVAAVFLYFTFRRLDLGEVAHNFGRVGVFESLVATAFVWVTFLVRGWRWWFLLPRPHEKGEFWAVQRAQALGYGVNNLVSRIGEVVRIVDLHRHTGRSPVQLMSTVVVDRLLLDLPVFALLCALSLYFFREPFEELVPNATSLITGLVAIIGLGVLAMLWPALSPDSLKRFLERFGFYRLPLIGPRLAGIVDQVSIGLKALSGWRDYAALFGITVLTWLISAVNFVVVIGFFGITADPQTLLILFALSVLAIFLPSPGAIGTFHYFVTLGLVRFAGAEETNAAAAATFLHAANFLASSFAAIGFWFYKPKVDNMVPESGTLAAEETTPEMG